MRRRISRRFRPTMTAGLDQLESRQLLSSGLQVVATISGATLNAVAAVSPTDIFAVGEETTSSGSLEPLIENFNGTSWSPVTNAPTVPGGSLSAISVLSANDIWAVGSNGSGSPLVEFFNGTSWSVQATPALASNGTGNDASGGGQFNAVTALSPTDVWAVGGLGNGRGGQVIEHFNGTSWSVFTAPTTTIGALDGIAAASSTDIFAVGDAGSKGTTPEVLQFNGTTWSALANGPSSFSAVAAFSPTDVWVSGGGGLWNFNGTTWTQAAFSNGDTANDLLALSGSSAGNIFAVGDGFSDANEATVETGFATDVAQWNGTTWSPVTSANPGDVQDGLVGVATLSNGTVVAVGSANPGGAIIESATFSVAPPVTAIATTTALTSTPGAPSSGAPVTFTATITPAKTGSAAPTGTVAFFSGSTLLGGGTVSNDVATFTTSALPVGTSSITATYEGDTKYAASTSSADSVTVTQATTTTAVSFSPALPVVGQDVTLTATLTPAFTGTAAPTGTVEFLDGSTLLGSTTLSSDTATLITTALPVGANAITAKYVGDTNYAASTSAAVTVTVVQAATPPSAGFQVVTSPAGPALAAISAVSATDIWAVGSTSTGAVIENFNGTSWTVFASPTVKGGVLDGVSALSSNDVWAVGSTLSNGIFTPLVEFFNGTSWSVQTTPALASNGTGNDTGGGGQFNAVTAISPTDVWAVGGLGNGRGGALIEHFNGTSWSVVPSPSTTEGELKGISAASSTDIFAVGFDGSKGNSAEVLQFNGTTWSALANGPTGTLATDAVDAISATDVWVTGGSGIWNFNGTSWTDVFSPGGDLVAISGSSANDIFAVGETISTVDEPLVVQWNGTSWSDVTSANPGGGVNSFQGVTTLSNGTAVAVGTVGIESNATTAAPAASVARPASSVSSVVSNDTVTPPAVAPTNVVVMGPLESQSSAPGTNKNGLTS